MTSVRKQLYITREQNRKLKRLAAGLGLTEAALVRDAIDAIPDPSASPDQRAIDQLKRAGLVTDEWRDRYVAPRHSLPDQSTLDRSLLQGPPMRLGEALTEDREGR